MRSYQKIFSTILGFFIKIINNFLVNKSKTPTTPTRTAASDFVTVYKHPYINNHFLFELRAFQFLSLLFTTCRNRET